MQRRHTLSFEKLVTIDELFELHELMHDVLSERLKAQKAEIECGWQHSISRGCRSTKPAPRSINSVRSSSPGGPHERNGWDNGSHRKRSLPRADQIQTTLSVSCLRLPSWVAAASLAPLLTRD